MKKNLINEVRRFQKIAGLLKEEYSYSKPLESFLKNFIGRRGMTSITVGDVDWNDLVKQIQRQFGRNIPDEGEFFGGELLDMLYDMGVKVNQEGDVNENDTKTIEVDGMTGIYITNVGNTELYSSESTEVGSNFDYFVVEPGKEPRVVSVGIDFDPEEGNEITAEYVMKKTGIQDVNLCRAIAQDIGDELEMY